MTDATPSPNPEPDDRPALLIVDDDATFCSVLATAMTRRGFDSTCAHTVEQALACAETCTPEYAVIDLRLPGTSGLILVEKLRALDPGTRIVMLTGYASIATAVEAVKLGATHYLAKPVDVDEILAAFERTSGDAEVPISAHPLSVNRLEWEYIQRVLTENNGNVSVTARVLKMHRRTLQRKLTKYPAKT
ncbi:response regulator transcription factor [Nitrosovibrio sp. Nv17]|jgi:two-component system response regulator RegA|uniref:response regulator transcription factor n=1 Tax=Nitrosovibrio sp. Nv17 TaxID=1855339 RepID=UPI0009090F3F|nr:response regulator transcription factor [Nitrosovibrio sp. Nv17]SFW23033.1 two-component system, response regulator RegA [Nitrosovibrio sp. Nv17]